MGLPPHSMVEPAIYMHLARSSPHFVGSCRWLRASITSVLPYDRVRQVRLKGTKIFG
jgi:hypothetical protein